MFRHLSEEIELFLRDRIEQQRIAGVLDDADGGPALGEDLLNRITDLFSRAAYFNPILIDDRLGRVMLRTELLELDLTDRGPSTGRRDEIAWDKLVLEIVLLDHKIAADENRIERIMFEGRRILDRTRELQAGLITAHGELTPEVLRRLDEEFWVHSFQQRVALATISRTPLPQDVIRVLPLLPDRMREPLVAALRDPEGTVEAMGFNTIEPKKLKLNLKGIG